MNSMGTVLDRILERRARAGYRQPPSPRERMPPDLAEPCARYPTAALVCFLAALGIVVAAVVFVIAVVVMANSKAASTAVPNANPPGAAAGRTVR